MRIVVTGPTGAVGIALIKECIQHNIEVLAICHRQSRRIERIPISANVKILELDLEEYADFIPTEEYQGYDVFYHFAWNGTIGNERNDMTLQHKNIGYALDAVSLAAKMGCNTFIGAGSQAEYGRVEGLLSAKVPTFPENGYGIAKLCAGQMTRILCGQIGIRHIWTRILSVYGPYDGELTMITSSIRKLLKGEIPAFTKGEQQWDYLYSADAASAMRLLGEKGKDGKIYCIGSGTTRKLADYIRIMRDTVNPDQEIALGVVPYNAKQVMYLCADITELQQDTGFEPKVDFETGIRETVRWVRENGRY